MVSKTIKLRSGHSIPTVGLGVWQSRGDEAVDAVRFALQAGYRLIDTAMIYENEVEVGQGVRASDVAREEIFVTTKLWNTDQGYKNVLPAFDASLQRLGLNYVDLYLIHWPFNQRLSGENFRAETWQAMEEILASDRARSIGVCNYRLEHLEEMKSYAKVMPAVNQFELHPFWFRKDLMEYCHQNKIAVEAYSPLARGKHLDDERITKIATAHGKTNAQVLLRWSLQHGNIVIPKSVRPERIKENFALYDFELTATEMAQLDALNENDSALFGDMSEGGAPKFNP